VARPIVIEVGVRTEDARIPTLDARMLDEATAREIVLVCSRII